MCIDHIQPHYFHPHPPLPPSPPFLHASHYYNMFKSIFVCVCVTGNQTQDLTHSRQMFYHWAKWPALDQPLFSSHSLERPWGTSLFCVWLVSQHELQFHPFCCEWQVFIFLYGWIILHCVYIPDFPYPSVDRHRGWFYTLASVNSSTV